MAHGVFDLTHFPVHLGLGASADVLPAFTGTPEWYQAYAAAHPADGVEGRLVSWHSFSSSWDMWEVHPHGSELVICTAGRMVLHQEIDGVRASATVEAGQAVINPPGAWHTADVDGEAAAIFVTAGLGTDHRDRAED